MVRRLAVFDPIFDDGKKVNLPRAFASAAMLDARRHEQPNLIRGLTVSDRRHHLVVVADGAERGNRTIGPAMPEKQLSAASYEHPEVRVGRGDTVIHCASAGDGSVEIESSGLPSRILEDDVLRIARRNTSHLRCEWRRKPSFLARGQQTRRGTSTTARILNTPVDLPYPSHLMGRQTFRFVA